MKKLKDLLAITGEYEYQGQKRHRYTNVGAVMQNEGKPPFIMLAKWFNPAGLASPEREGVYLMMRDPDQKPYTQQQNTQDIPAGRQNTPQGNNFANFEEIPF